MQTTNNSVFIDTNILVSANVSKYPFHQAVIYQSNRNSMKSIETIATVTNDGKITAQLPLDIPEGEHQVVIVIDEKPLTHKADNKEKRPPLNFPVHNCGLWPENLSLRREDMYGDWGR